jgi:1-aminocyclopropane-1-carboxylate deaminase/D-cysteine desulfhydrase-like pyridoxal-dependent ACC family enzyme
VDASPAPPLTAARAALDALPSTRLGHYPTPLEELPRLRAALGARPQLLIKRDDAIPFGGGGNKVRKLQMVARRALAEGADTLLTVGAVQSNHARATAAAAVKVGMRCVLVLNGPPPDPPRGNALLDALFGAEVEYVATREERPPAMQAAAERLRSMGRRPYEIPLGASIPLGALAYARAVGELLSQAPPPAVIVHSTSSGGTQAGLIAGCRLFDVPTRVIGVSADDPADVLRARVAALLDGMAELLGVAPSALAGPIEVDDSFVGSGYGIPTEGSAQALTMLARTEAVLLDPVYTAKAMAALVAWVREGRFGTDESVVFWHTGGQVALFA